VLVLAHFTEVVCEVANLLALVPEALHLTQEGDALFAKPDGGEKMVWAAR
jgi:hypothetical protein